MSENKTEEFIQKARKVYGDFCDYSKVEYVNSDTKVCIICPEHGHFWQTPYDHITGSNCPLCQRSNGEDAIMAFLTEHNVKFEQQKRFDSCRDKRPLPFDFYLSDYNLCVEYQGIQHFQPVPYFGGQEKFEYYSRHDSIKREWCSEEDNPNLLEITYKDDVNATLAKIIK